MPALELLGRVGFATLLGIAIGMERQWRSRLAGLQTMALVSMGSALYLILGAYAFEGADPTRVAAQIVTGIGFLGAGVIMKQGTSVTGLNTAATLWATAAVGAMAGAWFWREATAAAGIIIVANGLLHSIGQRMDRVKSRAGRETSPADYVLDVACRADAEADVRAVILRAVAGPELQLRSLLSTATSAPDEVRLRAELSADVRDDKVLEDAVANVSLQPEIRSARWSIRDEAPASWIGKD
ncbi:membrane protein [Mycolicibacterium setense]|uniref:Membrane protein n=1 Tax=Mycolicibacterium setense TaxID=431269 RepID=A0ABR4Z0R6_9MYCO|nr:MgtC/SapB family protein [Mycolicibacterium setense]KHO27987.1 membrane protein [Mycolicibacterium setense]